jgi:CHAP domain/WD40-like Beta Propeller Repeat
VVRRLVFVAAALAAVLGAAAAAPAMAAPAALRIPGTTACTGPDDFGAQYLSAAWPGGFAGVPVYSNGSAGYGSNCYNSVTTPSGTSVQSGMEWQCVELVNRLYLAKGWISSTWHGDGDQLYATAPSVGLTNEQPQGSITYLAPGDVISFNGPIDGGHAAVVSAVSGSAITLVNQNTSSSDTISTGSLVNGSFTLNGWSGYSAIGVIHAPYYGAVVQWSGDTKSQKTAWRVGSDGRRHWIPTISDYWCLVDGGVPGPYVLPADALDTAVPDDPGSEAPCGADLNGDGIVNGKDLAILASEYGTAGQLADINLDGKVNISDLAIMAAQWGKAPTAVPVTTPAAGAAVGPAALAQPTAFAQPAALSRSSALARPRQANGISALAGNDTSAEPSISADGNIVVFSSLSSNLAPGDTNGVLAVFAWNRSAGTVTRVSVDADGNPLSTPATDAEISPNGRYVAFDSGGDVYVKDLQTGALDRISQPNGDPAGEPNQAAYADDVTSSGLVVFESKATNLVAGDTSGASNVFVRQLQDGPIEQVSVSSDDAGSATGNADSYSGAASADGRYVAFASRATNLAAGDTNGQPGIFVRDLAAGTTTLVSAPPAGGQANGAAEFPSISADGQLVAFNSDATNLIAGNPGGYQQVYVRNLATGALLRVSQSNAGTAGNGDSTQPVLSGDGSRVAFQSAATNLVTGDTNDAEDVFVQDLARHLLGRVSVTTGLVQGNSSSFDPTLNGNGTTVAFSTDATNLLTSAAGTPEQIVVRDITRLPLSAGTPTITGMAKIGDTLTAHAGDWGPPGVTLRYQWYVNGTAIKKATARRLRLSGKWAAKTITVKVTASKNGYATATRSSKPTKKVAR